MQRNHKPNIILILCDDMGHWAMGCAGNPEIKTPHLDRMAAGGMRFTNFFCTSPVCSPARASIFTGKMPSQHGVQDWLDNKRWDDDAYLNGQATYVEFLSKDGYICGISGKWHLGNGRERQLGFKHWYIYHSAQVDYYHSPMIRTDDSGSKVSTQPEYITDLITEDALGFINTHKHGSAPFYASVHYTAPHKPWIGCHPQEYLDMYQDCRFDSVPNEPKHPWQINTHPWPEGEERRQTLQGYFAAVSAMDAGIGRILDAAAGIGNTLIFFMSDNGMCMGHHGVFGKGNGTFPMNLYDTSVKVPAIAYQPGVIPSGAVCGDLLSQYDFLPTILDWASIPHPCDNTLPGKSFANVLNGVPRENPQLSAVHCQLSTVHCQLSTAEYGPVRMIRNSEWKYIHRYPYGPHELYRIDTDPGERDNLYGGAAYADVVQELKQKLDVWFQKYVNPEIDAVREPITGWGQTARSGTHGKGAKAFHQSEEDLRKARNT
jgi:arylsulfatase A-like enzyme